jgi:hypothetical protein
MRFLWIQLGTPDSSAQNLSSGEAVEVVMKLVELLLLHPNLLLPPLFGVFDVLKLGIRSIVETETATEFEFWQDEDSSIRRFEQDDGAVGC